MLFRQRAFTLIELLIVVAIIAILAAIAVPNFLQAQTRAKVSRVKSDMRTVAVAVESYRVDTNLYPFAGQIGDPSAPVTANAFDGVVSSALTTPVSYLTSLPVDVFMRRDANGRPIPLHYGNKPQSVPLNGPMFFHDLLTQLSGEENQCAEWYTNSHGPDLDQDRDLTLANPDLATRLYDPTNGTVSNGDIYNLGPCIGFLDKR